MLGSRHPTILALVVPLWLYPTIVFWRSNPYLPELDRGTIGIFPHVNGNFRNINSRYLPYIRPIFQAQISGNIPTKYDLKYVAFTYLQILEFPLIFSTTYREVKWLPPGTTLNEMREFAMSFNSEIRVPSFAVFSRVYHSDWQSFLKVRSERQHTKCNDCQN